MYTGFVVAGALLALSGVVRNPPWLVSAFFGLLVPILAVSHPVVYRRLSRWGRDIARAALGICCALYAAVVASGAPVASIFGGFVLLTSSVAYRRMRIRFKKTACAGCPELGAADPICSGYAEQAVSVRRFQVTIEDLLNRDSMPPPVAVRSGRR